MTIIDRADDDSPIEYERFLSRSEPLTDTLRSHSSLIIDHQERERHMQITRTIKGSTKGPTVKDLQQLTSGLEPDIVVSIDIPYIDEGRRGSNNTWTMSVIEENNA